MRKITEIIVHCTATIEGYDFGLEDVDRWHREQNYNGIGYHYLIDIHGNILKGRDEEIPGAHVVGRNANSIGVCYVGGLGVDSKPKDTRNPAQKNALEGLLVSLLMKYPESTIHGHNEYSNKACPSFCVADEYGHLNK